MKHLVIITPKDGLFAQKLNLSCRFKLTSASANFAYFTYIGVFPPKHKVLNILSSFDFKKYSLDKEANYLRLKVHVE